MNTRIHNVIEKDAMMGDHHAIDYAALRMNELLSRSLTHGPECGVVVVVVLR